MLLWLSAHPSGCSARRATPRLRAKTMPWYITQTWHRLHSLFSIDPCPDQDHTGQDRHS